MYNEYDNLSFEEQLQISEQQIRRRHQQRIFLRRNAEMLEQELELEAQLLEENPELAQVIHQMNLQEIQAQQQGFNNTQERESISKSKNVWGNVFPGL